MEYVSCHPYPFPAFVGQEDLKRLLLITIVNPKVGGILIRGEKGTGKSTLARACVPLLPREDFLDGCVFHLTPEQRWFCRYCRDLSFIRKKCHPETINRSSPPFLTLPLNVTEENLCGGMDLEETLSQGRVIFGPGLLCGANHGVLYVDEINLLDRHLVNILLDVIASGINIVEREGISLYHPSNFILIGSMNPEEGELAPELTDRFGLSIEVKGLKTPEERVELIKRREEFDADPVGFEKRFFPSLRMLQKRILMARASLRNIRSPSAIYSLVCEICRDVPVEGHRGDIALLEAARANAAIEGREEVLEEDVLYVAPYVVQHRRKRQETSPSTTPQKKDPSPSPEEKEGVEGDTSGVAKEGPHASREEGHSPSRESPSTPGDRDRVFEIGEVFKVREFMGVRDNMRRRAHGKRTPSKIRGKKGHYMRATTHKVIEDIAIDATIRAAAPYQLTRRQGLSSPSLKVVIYPGDLRGKIRKKKTSNLILFVLDTSGSMGARGRMSATKGAILSLLLDSYQKRDKVALITFNREEATLILPPTNSMDMAVRLLKKLPVGGRTPLSLALSKTYLFLQQQLRRSPFLNPVVLFITDGRPNVSLRDRPPVEEVEDICISLARDFPGIKFIVIDTEKKGPMEFGLCNRWATLLGAHYFKIEDLKKETLLNLAKEKMI